MMIIITITIIIIIVKMMMIAMMIMMVIINPRDKSDNLSRVGCLASHLYTVKNWAKFKSCSLFDGTAYKVKPVSDGK